MRLHRIYPQSSDTLQEAFFALIANAMWRASGTIVFILVGRLCGPEDAGVFALAMGYLAILTTLFGGIDDLLVREMTTAPGDVLKLVAAYSALRMPAVMLFCWIAILFGRTVNQIPTNYLNAFYLIVSSAVFDGLVGVGHAVLYAFGALRSLIYSAFTVLLIRAGVGSIALMAGGVGAIAVLWPISSLIGAAIVALNAVRTVRASRTTLKPLKLERPLLCRMAGLMPGFGTVSLLSALEYQCDVILLSALQSSATVAIYAAAASIVNLLTLVAQAYRVTVYPRLVRLRSEGPQVVGAFILRSTRNMFAFGLVIALGTVLTAHWLVREIFGARFQATEQVLVILIWNVVFLFVNVPLVRYLIAVGHQNRVAGVLLISLSVNLVANWLLIPSFGPVGSAWSRLISSAVFLSAVSLLVLHQLRRIASEEPTVIEANK